MTTMNADRWVLQYCPECMQMTNHGCLKCAASTPASSHTEEAGKVEDVSCTRCGQNISHLSPIARGQHIDFCSTPTPQASTPPASTVEREKNYPPEVIYLQWHGDGDPDDPAPIDRGSVTWCEDKINNTDVEYVLAGASRRRVTDEELDRLVDEHIVGDARPLWAYRLARAVRQLNEEGGRG